MSDDKRVLVDPALPVERPACNIHVAMQDGTTPRGFEADELEVGNTNLVFRLRGSWVAGFKRSEVKGFTIVGQWQGVRQVPGLSIQIVKP